MASVTSLREHLVDELNDLGNAEQQLIDALPQMAEKASAKPLKAAFRQHLEQTRRHARRIADAVKLLGESASSETCEAMEGLLKEGQELMSSGEPGPVLDAMLITAAQKVEHYEMATYGTVRTYAQVLGESKVARLLEQTLKEEKAADQKLTGIAERGVNARAAKAWHERTEAKGLLQKGAEWVGSTVGGAVSRVMPRAKAADAGRGRPKRASRPTRPSRSRRRGRSTGR